MRRDCRCISCITPPHLLKRLLESRNPSVREAALGTMLATARLRGERAVRAFMGATAGPAQGRRTVLDCKTGTVLASAVVVRGEDGPPVADPSVNNAFDGLGATRDFYQEVFGRSSIDGQGMRLDGYVHYGQSYNNAFWDGQRMVFGDGDGVVFTDFTGSLDVIAHELTHGVTEFSAGLEYHLQPGALNESMSDVFGSVVKQWHRQQTAEEADWLIGPEIFTPGVEADALRSMKAPGTAYDNETLGKDPQPDHMDRFVRLPDTEEGDYGGVHINSGIPNRAFYLTAIGLGGPAWLAPAHIWYTALQAANVRTQFQDFADLTYATAGELYGSASAEQQAVLEAWREVGIRISGVPVGAGRGRGRAGGKEADSLAALTRQVEGLAAQVKAQSRELAALKARLERGAR